VTAAYFQLRSISPLINYPPVLTPFMPSILTMSVD